MQVVLIIIETIRNILIFGSIIATLVIIFLNAYKRYKRVDMYEELLYNSLISQRDFGKSLSLELIEYIDFSTMLFLRMVFLIIVVALVFEVPIKIINILI